jgi:hypothetical protein
VSEPLRRIKRFVLNNIFTCWGQPALRFHTRRSSAGWETLARRLRPSSATGPGGDRSRSWSSAAGSADDVGKRVYFFLRR